MRNACFFFSSRRRHTRWPRDWSSDVCSSDLGAFGEFDFRGAVVFESEESAGAVGALGGCEGERILGNGDDAVVLAQDQVVCLVAVERECCAVQDRDEQGTFGGFLHEV